MKKLLVLLCGMLLSTTMVFAQKGDFALGVNGAYASKLKNAGVGVRAQYGLTDIVRFDGGLDYFFKKEETSLINVNLNLHYVLPVTENISFYPLAGVTYQSWNADGGELSVGSGEYEESFGFSMTLSRIGANLGAGLDFNITEKTKFFVEGKYQLVADFSQFVVGAGLAFKF